jgi:hypothetical protein
MVDLSLRDEMQDNKYEEKDIKYVKAGDWVTVAGLFRVVAGVTYDHDQDRYTLIFDHGDYQSYATYQTGMTVLVMS